MQEPDWFISWFDTPYYHILYKHRDDTEAHDFIDVLFDHLKPNKEALIMDLACGKGRHAIYMNQKGYNVVGYDLADENILFAKNFENDRLTFEVRDMRENLGNQRFDWVFNLFTSIGYFETRDENIDALKAIAKALKPGGKLLIDFMNASKVANRLVPKEHKRAENIDFYIERFTRDNHIIKEIKFNVDGEEYQFEEKVQILTKSDFEEFIEKAGLKVSEYFGNLSLEPFNEITSDRLIILAEKL